MRQGAEQKRTLPVIGNAQSNTDILYVGIACNAMTNVDSLDWKNPSPEDIQKRVLDRVKPGSIVLFHNAAVNTPAALPGIIEELLKDGYKLVKVSEILHSGNFTINHMGKQIPS